MAIILYQGAVLNAPWGYKCAMQVRTHEILAKGDTQKEYGI